MQFLPEIFSLKKIILRVCADLKKVRDVFYTRKF